MKHYFHSHFPGEFLFHHIFEREPVWLTATSFLWPGVCPCHQTNCVKALKGKWSTGINQGKSPFIGTGAKIHLLIAALYKMFAWLLNFPTYFFHTYSLSYLSTFLRIGPFRFQAACRKRRLKLALVFCADFVLSYVLLCIHVWFGCIGFSFYL